MIRLGLGLGRKLKEEIEVIINVQEPRTATEQIHQVRAKRFSSRTIDLIFGARM